MKVIKSYIVSAVAIALAIFMVTPAGAAVRNATINVAYGLTLQFNEEDVELTDVNGKKVEPMVYEGTTYVPIRAISNLFGAGVAYDSETRTAYVYDDFSEACYIAYGMSRTVSTTWDTALAEPSLLPLVPDDLYAERYAKKCQENYDYAMDLCNQLGNIMNTAGEDNENIGLLYEYAGQEYQDYVDELDQFYDAVFAYIANPTTANNDKVLAATYSLNEKGGKVMHGIDRFFQDYCSWRDIGQYEDPLMIQDAN